MGEWSVSIHSKSVVYNIAVILLITNTLYYYTAHWDANYWLIGPSYGNIKSDHADLPTTGWTYRNGYDGFQRDNTMTVRYE